MSTTAIRLMSVPDSAGTADVSNRLNTASAATKSPPKTTSSGTPIARPRTTDATLLELGLRNSPQRMSDIKSGTAPTSAEQLVATIPPP